MMYLQNLAMISNFYVKRRIVAIDVSFVKRIRGAELPRASMVYPLDHRVKRVVLGWKRNHICSPPFAVRSFRKIGDAVGHLATDTQMPGLDVGLVVTPYDNDEFDKDLAPYKDEREGGRRCMICYRKRMGEAYDYAEENGFDYFTTVMTISRQKNSLILNSIGKELEAKHSKTKYFYSDFKKDDGIEKGKALRDKYGLYQQLCCGCKYTYEEGERRRIEKGL